MCKKTVTFVLQITRKMITRKVPLRRNKPLTRSRAPRRTAPRRQVEIDLYHSSTRPEFLKEHPSCEICSKITAFISAGGQHKWAPVCGIKAVEIHHKRGKTNGLLNDRRYFMASCSSKGRPNGHNWIRDHQAAAMAIGIILPRNN